MNPSTTSILRGFILAILAGTCVFLFSLKSIKPAKNLTKWEQALVKTKTEFQTLSMQENGDSLSRELLLAFSHDYPILTDWLRQDQPESWKAYFRQKGTASDVKVVENVLDEIIQYKGEPHALQQKLSQLKNKPSAETESQLAGLYVQACEKRRELRLKHLLSHQSPIVFAQHHNFKMSFIGYTEGLSDARHERFFKPGAKLTRLSFDGLYGEAKELIDDPYGMIRDVDASPDGSRLLFSWKKSDRLDDYHIHQYDLATGDIRQITHGLGRADYEPVYLPDGDILFASTRPEQSVPCWWTEISNLYRMNGEGKYLRRLAIDQVHTLYPTVMENGRIIYTRWDYSDRGQNYPHPLFNMNPDGTDQRVYYGGNSWFPTSLLHARAIPGTEKVMAIAAGHHTRQHGKVVVLDVSEGRDEGKGMHFIAPKRDVPYERVDRAQQHGDQFRYPYPINESEFLVSYLPDNPDYQSKNPKERYSNYGDDAVYGLYWMDVDGRRELLYQDNEISVGRPVMVKRLSNPPAIPDTVDYRQKTGIYYVHDVYEGVGLKGIPRGTAKKIRVVRLNYRAAGVGSSRNQGEGGGSLNSGPVSIGNGSWDIKEILGDVDIHADGSALFEVPAMQSIYLQVLDEKGRVIQNTRSWDTVRPGEKKACRGCHAKKEANFYAFKEENTLAWKQPAQQLQPFYGDTRGFSFIQEVQPILDQKCVSCHDGSKSGVMSLKGELKGRNTLEKRKWSDAYLNLTHAEKRQRNKDAFYMGNPEHEVVNWISKMSKPTELEPYAFGAATSTMMHMLEKGHYNVDLTEEEYHKMAAWLDLLVPFIGEYREANDWSDKEMAFYNYYEHKRGVHKKEELKHIKDWLAANGQESEAAPDVETYSDERKAMKQGYRQLAFAAKQLNENRWKISFDRAVMIDRIHLNNLQEIHPEEITILLGDGTWGVQANDLQKNSGVVSLKAPQSTAHLVIQVSNNATQLNLDAIEDLGSRNG